MSHFTVLVVAQSDWELQDKLAPFHEYECTGIEEYLEFVGETEQALREEYETKVLYDGTLIKEMYSTFDQFVSDWHGYHEKRGDVWGRMTNPNAKWDWWVIGGRWTGSLILRDENVWHGVGKPGLFGSYDPDPLKADYARKGDINWEAMDEDFQTFAFIDHEGKWVDREDMGGMSSPNENTEIYKQAFIDFLKSCSNDDILWVVDCHI